MATIAQTEMVGIDLHSLGYRKPSRGVFVAALRRPVTIVLLLACPLGANAQGAGSALAFDGENDYVSVSHHPSLNLDWEYTIELFFEPDELFDASATDYQGILDKGDYQMFLDPTDGKLKFVQPMAGGFSGQFNSSLNGPVRALVEYNNELYVGGEFVTAGGAPALHIAKWDGTTWSAVGSGLDGGNVLALLVYNGELYAGGEFQDAGGIDVNGIAKWDGSNWSAVGPGFDGGPVNALAEYDNDLYAGGEFTENGLIVLNHIARWDGSEWSAVADGFDDAVYALLEYGGELYAGGSFANAGAVPVEKIARWNGTVWSDVAGGVGGGDDPTVYALAVYGVDLVAGGDFETAGGLPAPLMARWDGSTWSNMGTEEAVMWGEVWTLVVLDNKLYAAGDLMTLGPVRHVAEWDGNTWNNIGVVDGAVSVVGECNGELYAGGSYSSIGGTPTDYLAEFRPPYWFTVGAMPGGAHDWVEVRALAVYQDELYVGGDFPMVGDEWMANIAKWDGTAWSCPGGGVDYDIDALAVYNGDLYAGGGFTEAGGVPVERIARWDGSNWSALGSGCDSHVLALTEYDDQLYVGGEFTTAGGAGAEHIARWTGSNWDTVGTGTDGDVCALAVYDGDLYVGGEFTMAGGVPAENIARWNGSTWSAVGSGLSGGQLARVYAFAVYNNKLYAGGRFMAAGGEEVYNIAQWDGASWSPVGTGMNSTVRALAVYNNELYAGGEFYIAGLQVTPYIAKWNGSVWSTVGVGTDEWVFALAVWDNEQAGGLFVGGLFHRAGEVISPYFARWTQSLRTIASARTSWPPRQHHVAVTHNPDEYQLEMYVNGILEAAAPAEGGNPDLTVTPLWIGHSSGPPIDGGAGEFFAGQIDEVRIANAYASSLDIQDLLNVTLSDPGAYSSVAYYRFDEGSGEVTTDSSENHNSGTLIGSPDWITSTAPLGDEAVWTDQSLPITLSSSFGDWFEIYDLTGAPPFAALIRVDGAPNSVDVGSGLFQVFDSHYFEVWIPDGSNPTYTAVYGYAGHPGVTDENVLALASRPDASTPVWEDTEAVPDTGDDTLTVSGETGTQYILGEKGFELTMAVSPPGGGTTNPPDGSTTKYLIFTEVDIRATPNPGYRFDHWEASAGDPPVVDPICWTEATVLMDADKTVTAVFGEDTAIDSLWMGGTACPGFPTYECWNSAVNWCPRIVPDNVTDMVFEVTIDQGTATLNISPTIRTLSLSSGATVLVGEASGAAVRTLAVTEPVINDGTFHASGAKRLVLDAPAIDQTAGGLLLADNNGVIQINGALVTGGIARTLDCDSAIELIGGAEFNNVTIETLCGITGPQAVIVPDAQSGVLAGTIVNQGGVRVAAVEEITSLAPGPDGVTLSGTGGIVLSDQDLAWFGAFGRTITNDSGHSISGAGVLYGGLTNNPGATIDANQNGASLWITGVEWKVNDGLFRATNGGILDIWTDVTGSGEYRADGGTIAIPSAFGYVHVAGSTLTIANAGTVAVDNDTMLDLSGAVTIHKGGSYHGTTSASAALLADNILIAGDGLAEGGQMLLTGAMDVAAGSITVDGVSPCGRGCTPPVVSLADSTTCNTKSLTVMQGGLVESSGDAAVEIVGILVIDTGGQVQASGGSLLAGSIDISNGGQLGGSLIVSGSFIAGVAGDVVMSMFGCKGIARGCTPPVLNVSGDRQTGGGPQLDLDGALRLIGAADITVEPGPTVTLAGDFDNQSNNAAVFDWSGGLMLDGTAVQTFEVAGTDLGAVPAGLADNFALGELELASGADVQFVDTFDNDLIPQSPCGEALYVDTLVLRNGSSITLNDCNIYYIQLSDEGASITLNGCGELLLISTSAVCPGDSNCDDSVSWRDIDYLVAAMNDNVSAWEAMFLPGTPTCSFENNDVNADGTVNWRDIDPFVALMNTTCP
ncbi:MAG: hypothetical protein KAY37_02895 [Phycisphaerae bacterium]|nr:hypothetical protein [Phycisphaerae bacterium]